jgi:hypothetical protein
VCATTCVIERTASCPCDSLKELHSIQLNQDRTEGKAVDHEQLHLSAQVGKHQLALRQLGNFIQAAMLSQCVLSPLRPVYQSPLFEYLGGPDDHIIFIP